MANAIKKISVQRGYDVTRYTLNCFGGAGGQHACLVADALGMTTVLIHPYSSLLSAYGMGLADIRAHAAAGDRGTAWARPRLRRSPRSAEHSGKRRATKSIAQGVPAQDIVVHVRAHLRYAGTDTALEVPAFCPTGNGGAHLARDEIRLRSRAQIAFGFIDESKADRRRGGVGRSSRRRRAKFAEPARSTSPHAPLPAPTRRVRFYSGRAWHDAAIFLRDQLAPGHRIAGPAIIIEPHQTVVVEDGWRAEVTAKNHLVLERAGPLSAGTPSARRPIR